MKTELVIGVGHKTKKIVHLEGESNEYQNPVTIDIDPGCKPDILWDLNVKPWPCADEEFDEVHAYEVLEHLGKQGDWKAFFDDFTEIHRVLKSGGKLHATVPKWDSLWAFGDPSHTRVINEGTLSFLCQEIYEKDVGKTDMTDFRHYYKADFTPISVSYNKDKLVFVLQKK